MAGGALARDVAKARASAQAGDMAAVREMTVGVQKDGEAAHGRSRNIRLIVAYDGTAYAGFQRQQNGVAVQNVLEAFLSRLCGQPVTLTGSGRTDAGVHARGQVVNFHTTGRVPCANIVAAARTLLPQDIVVLSADEVPEDFHARKSARWKRYVYRVRVTQAPDPFTVRYTWQLAQTPDLSLLRPAADFVVGTHDFSGYQSAGSVPVSPVRTVYAADWTCSGTDYTFTITGDGFVYHQVRNLVWAMVQVGLGTIPLRDFCLSLTQKRGEFENSPAPACGLYLDEVGYEDWK